MTNSQEMQLTSLDKFRLSEESSSPSVSALVSKLNSSLAASNLFCKDTNNDKGNSSTNQNDKKIEEILPWLSSFNNRCRSAVGSKNIKLFESLLMLYLRNIGDNVKSCYLKPNRAAKLKESMYQTLIFFHLFYKDIKEPFENSYYLDKMSVLVSMYIDMELKASRRRKESGQKLARKLTTALYVFLDNSIEHILDAILKSKFFTKNFREIAAPILGSVLNKVRMEPTNEMLYVRYILAFKLWKKICVDNEVRKKINKIALQQLHPPKNFVDKSKLYSKVLPWISKKKDVTLFLMQAKFNLKSACQAFLKMVNDTQQSGFSSPMMLMDKPLYFGNRDGPRFSEYDQLGKQDNGIISLIEGITENLSFLEANAAKATYVFDQETISSGIAIKRKVRYDEKPFKKKIKREKELIPFSSLDYKKHKSNEWQKEPDILKNFSTLENKSIIIPNKRNEQLYLDQNKRNYESDILNIEVKQEPTDIIEKQININQYKLLSNNLNKQKKFLKSSNLIPKNKIFDNGLLLSKHNVDNNFSKKIPSHGDKNSEFMYKFGSKEQNKKLIKEKKNKLNKEKKLKNSIKQKKNKKKEKLILKDLMKEKIKVNIKEKLKKKKLSQNQKREASPVNISSESSDIVELEKPPIQAELITLEEPPHVNENSKKLIKTELENNSFREKAEKTTVSNYTTPPPSPPIHITALEKIAQSYNADTPVLSPCDDNSCDTLICNEIKSEIQFESDELNSYHTINTPSPSLPDLSPPVTIPHDFENEKLRNSPPDELILENKEIPMKSSENKKLLHYSNSSDSDTIPSDPFNIKESNSLKKVQSENDSGTNIYNLNEINCSNSNTFKTDQSIENSDSLNIETKLPSSLDNRIESSSSEKCYTSKSPISDSQFANNNSISVDKIPTKSDKIPHIEILQITPKSLDIIIPENSHKKAFSKAIQTHVESSEIKRSEIQDVSSSSFPIKKVIFSPSRNTINEKKSLPFLPQQVISIPKISQPISAHRDISLHPGNAFNKEPEPKANLSKLTQNSKQNLSQNVIIPSDSNSLQTENIGEIHSFEEVDKSSNQMIKQSMLSTSFMIQTPDSSTPVDNQLSRSTSPKIQRPDSSSPIINQISEPISSKSVSQISSQSRKSFNGSNTDSDELLNLAPNNEIRPDSSSQINSDKIPKVKKVESYQHRQVNKGFSKCLTSSVSENEKEIQISLEVKEKDPSIKNKKLENNSLDNITINNSEVKSIPNKPSGSIVNKNSKEVSSLHPLLKTNKTLKVLLSKLDPSSIPSSHSSKVDSEEIDKIPEEKIEANTDKQIKCVNYIPQEEPINNKQHPQEFLSSKSSELDNVNFLMNIDGSKQIPIHKKSLKTTLLEPNEIPSTSKQPTENILSYPPTPMISELYKANYTAVKPVVNITESNAQQDLRISPEQNSDSKDTEELSQYEEEEPSPPYEPLDKQPLVHIYSSTPLEKTEQESTHEIDNELSLEAAKTAAHIATIDQENSNADNSGKFNQYVYHNSHILPEQVEINTTANEPTADDGELVDNGPLESIPPTTSPVKILSSQDIDVYCNDSSIDNSMGILHPNGCCDEPPSCCCCNTSPNPSNPQNSLVPHLSHEASDIYDWTHLYDEYRNYPELPTFELEKGDILERYNEDNLPLKEGTKRRSRNFLYNQRYMLKRRLGCFLPDSPDVRILSPSKPPVAQKTPASFLLTQPQEHSETNEPSLSIHTITDTSGTTTQPKKTRGMCWNSNPVKHYPKWQPQDWPLPVPVPTFNSHHVKCNCRDCAVRNLLLKDGSEQIPIPHSVPVPYQANLSELAARKSEDERLLKKIEESLFNYNTQDKDCSLPLKKRLKTMLLGPTELPTTSKQPTENLLSYPSTPMISIAELDNSILIKFPPRSNESLQTNSNESFPCIIGPNEYYTAEMINNYAYDKANYTGVENTEKHVLNQTQNSNEIIKQNANINTIIINPTQNINQMLNTNGLNQSPTEMYVDINNEISTNGTYVQNEKLHSKSKNPEIDSNVIDENTSPSTSFSRPNEFAGRQFRTPAQRKEIPPSMRVFNNIELFIQPESNKSQNQITVELNQIKNNYSYENNPIIVSNSNEKEALDLTDSKKDDYESNNNKKKRKQSGNR